MSSNIDNTAPIRYSSTRQTESLSDDEKRARRKRSERDFNRVMSKTDDEHHEPDNKVLANEEEAEKTPQEEDSRKTTLTLFDLSSPKKVAKDASSAAVAEQMASSQTPAVPTRKSVLEQAAAAQAPVKGSKEHADSPSVLYGKMRTTKKEGDSSLTADDALTVERKFQAKARHDDATADADAGAGFNGRFGTEQADLSYVNPLVTGSGTVAAADVRSAEAKANPNMQRIIDQLVDKVYMMQVDGKSEMTITLKHPPLFEGANLVVTSFDSAKGEFNISFENLTQAAKKVLDMQVNQESLRHGLELKGYMVHIVTTTTQIENRVPNIDQPSNPDKEREGRSGGGQRRGGQTGGKGA